MGILWETQDVLQEFRDICHTEILDIVYPHDGNFKLKGLSFVDDAGNIIDYKYPQSCGYFSVISFCNDINEGLLSIVINIKNKIPEGYSLLFKELPIAYLTSDNDYAYLLYCSIAIVKDFVVIEYLTD